jgi:pilus assembly protein CpaB
MRSRVLPMALALVLAFVAAVAVLVYVRGTEDRVRAEARTSTMLVSTGMIPTGLSLAEAQAQGLLEETTVPAQNVPAGSLNQITTQTGPLLALADIPPGQVLFAAGFAAQLPDLGPIDVPEGMAAVTVQLNDPQRVGTFLRPGAQVAVFDTVAVPRTDTSAGEVRETRVLLPRITVLAVGAATVAADAEGDAATSALITVAVDQKQAERLIHASQTGALTFALLDGTTTMRDDGGVNDTTIFKGA